MMTLTIKPNNSKNENAIELADILRIHIGDYKKKYPLFLEQYKVVYDLLNCRTEHLGGHIEQCDQCGNKRFAYHSCRNRHCPKCQNMPREKWIEARKTELLPVKYFHNVFTLPHDLNPLILINKKIMLNILFKAVSATLLTFGENPKNGLGGKLGFIAILHTWDQLLNPHFHLHCLVPGGAVSNGWDEWLACKNDYLFNVEALGLVFRGKFIDLMTKAYLKGELKFSGISSPFAKPEKFQELKNKLYSKNWIVYIKEPIKNPEYVLEYLGRYTHRVAISNYRILSLKSGMVTLKYKNRETGQTEQIDINAVEFIRRFLNHVLPNRFVRIRHYGFLTNRNKSKNLKIILGFFGKTVVNKVIGNSVKEMMTKLTGKDIMLCPCCKKGEMHVVDIILRGSGQSPSKIIHPQVFLETG